MADSRRRFSRTVVPDRLDLREQLLKLSPRERSCVVLRYYEDLKVDDIAQWLGISPGAELFPSGRYPAGQ